MNADENFESLNLELPSALMPLGIYKPGLTDGKYFYTSGHGPVIADQQLTIGRVGDSLDRKSAKAAALQTGLSILATIKRELGSLSKIKRVIRIFGMVNCTNDFHSHPYVIDGCSELFEKVWGSTNGVGVRSAIGVSSLPQNIPVEIEVIFELNN